MCYKYAWSFLAAAATAEALRRCHVPQRCEEGVLGQALAAALPGLPTRPPVCLLTPHQTQPPPWAALGPCHVKLVCQPQLLHSHRQPKGSDSCCRGSKLTTKNTGAATTPPTRGGAATLRHRLIVKHLLKCPSFQPSAQRLFPAADRKLLLFRSHFVGCCLLRCMEVAILMDISVAIPT